MSSTRWFNSFRVWRRSRWTVGNQWLRKEESRLLMQSGKDGRPDHFLDAIIL